MARLDQGNEDSLVGYVLGCQQLCQYWQNVQPSSQLKAKDNGRCLMSWAVLLLTL